MVETLYKNFFFFCSTPVQRITLYISSFYNLQLRYKISEITYIHEREILDFGDQDLRLDL